MKRNMATREVTPKANAMGMPLNKKIMAIKMTIAPITSGFMMISFLRR
jgi:hypothetical protein